MLIDDLKTARLSAGLTQKALGVRIGSDAQAIKRLEGGVGSMRTLMAVCEALDFRLTGLGPGETLGEQLRHRRLKRSLTLAKLATRCGLARGTVAGLERGDGSVASLLSVLAVLAPGVRRRAPERSYWGQRDKRDRDVRLTPPDFMETIYAAFGEVDLDPCGNEASSVVARRRILLGEGGDGLSDDWSGELAFNNPPFSALLTWLRRAHEQWSVGNVRTVVCLIPVRTDSAWFHETLAADADIFLLQGRVRFLDLDGRAQATPFSLMLLTLGATPEQRRRFQRATPGFWLSRDAE